MDVTPMIRSDHQVIQSYSTGRFRISGRVFDGPVIVTTEQSFIWTVHQPDIAGMTSDDMAQLTELSDWLDVVLLGCGRKMQLVPSRLKQDMRAAGLSIEPMDTGAACRTYNVLLSEGRRVAAALLPFQ